jgi:CRISPR-associated protein Csc1
VTTLRVEEIEIKVHDPVFFSTREANKKITTGRYLHNYALTYSLLYAANELESLTEYSKRWEKTSEEGPKYEEDFENLDLYVFPARPINVNFTTEIVNTTSETYHEQVTAERAKRYFSGHTLQRIDIGSTFRTYALIDEDFTLPRTSRLGKFMGKIKLESEQREWSRKELEDVRLDPVLNVMDLPMGFHNKTSQMKIERMRPSPVMTAAVYSGNCIVLETPDGEEPTVLPYDVGYFKKENN